MAKILIVCVARHLANVAPELFEAIQAMILYTLRTPRHKKDTIDLTILTEQPRDSKGRIKKNNQARACNMNKIRRHAIKNYDYVVKVDSDMIPPAHGLV